MIDEKEKPIHLRQFKIQDSFWNYYQNLILEKVIPYQEQIMKDEIPEIEKSHAIENFKIAAGLSEGEFYGQVFQDSDLAKWMEALGNALSISDSTYFKVKSEEMIGIIEKAQEEDGYLDTFFQIKEPEKKWENLLECHELYCMGHMIEAAVSHFESTGSKRFLNVASKIADCIDAHFGKEKHRGIPGHEEIELALLRLYKATNEERYKNLAKYFIDERGLDPNFFAEERKIRNWEHWPMDPEDREYSQNDKPVRMQDHAEGHSVRATYLYTAMCDLAMQTNDEELYNACLKIWNNIISKKMYITGGIGSSVDGEAFTIDYDLPNDTCYTETCASIGLIFFARKLLQSNVSSVYADIMEKVLYNGVLCGMQHDGTKFFYVNPLEVIPNVSGKLYGYKHTLPERPCWYACACCPPNVARLLTSIGKYAWGENENTIYSHLFIGGEFTSKQIGSPVISLITEYPWKSDISYRIEEIQAESLFSLAIRIPCWAKKTCISVNGIEEFCEQNMENGYYKISRLWKKGDLVKVIFDMPVSMIHANEKVRKTAGCVAVQRGPLVYCMEGIDNGNDLHSIKINPQHQFAVSMVNDKDIGEYAQICTKGIRIVSEDEQLYSDLPLIEREQEIKMIPYFLWGNRGLNEMRVWCFEK